MVAKTVDPFEEYVSITGAAGILHLSKSRVQQLTKTGELTYHETAFGRVYGVKELRAYLERKVQEREDRERKRFEALSEKKQREIEEHA